MDLGDLNIFRAVVQTGGITRAAEKLHRVQSNVTTRVRQLEQDLGVDLFIREGKRMHLSPAGKLLLNYADQLLDLAQEAREAVHDVKPRGLFRLGSMESTAAIRLPRRSTNITTATRSDARTPRWKYRELPAKVLRGNLTPRWWEPIADAPFDKVTVFEEGLRSSPPRVIRRSARRVIPAATMLAFGTGCTTGFVSSNGLHSR